jgi:hypothetical protein
VRIANLKWIHALQAAVEMVHDARRAKTIVISTVLVPLDMLDDFVTKTSMNVNCHLHHAETEQHAKTPTDLISVCVQKDMKEKIAPSIRTIALRFHAKMVEHVSMA